MNPLSNIRRCHICSSITESKINFVSKCDGCGKHFSPFYFFDQALAPLSSDFGLRAVFLPGECWPIQGLNALWEQE